MDIFSQLKADHDAVKELFRKIEAADGVERKALFDEVKVALVAHSKAEDQTFYSELDTDEELEDMIAAARDEHEAIDELLDKVSGLAIDAAHWQMSFNELVRAVEGHVRQEEDEIFPRARQILDSEDAEELGNSMASLEAQFRPQA